MFKPFIQKHSCPSDDALLNMDPSKKWVGSIDTSCQVADVIANAAESARLLCFEKYFDAPEVEIVHQNSIATSSSSSSTVTNTCIPAHLYHIMFELFKNSCRAVAEHHVDFVGPLPSVNCPDGWVIISCPVL